MDLSTLNKPQAEAVTTIKGPLLVLAGAGSGKTRALTHRVAYLIQDMGVRPYQIMALTFTNKAAREMKERVESLVGPDGSSVWVSTFHSGCARILRIDIEKIGYSKDFVIYDDGDQLSLITQIQKQMNISEENFPKRSLKALFSDAKNRSLKPLSYILERGGFKADKQAEAFKLYSKSLRDNNALDFDDLLIKTLELFEKAPEVLKKYQDRFHYIHVDEYQDTNLAQYKFISLLAAGHGNLCVVGDDDQSIYGWRGADITNILEFEKSFPNAKVIRLEQNYRSTGKILDAANAVIANNDNRKAKTLWTQNQQGEPIDLYIASSGMDEADYACRTILLNNTAGKPYSDFAVLYRTNAQSRPFEEKLTYYGIPYTVYGSLRFYDRKEIKDILGYLRLMVNPKDDISLLRVVNLPKRGLGDVAIGRLQAAATEAGISLLEACEKAAELPLATREKDKFGQFGKMMIALQALSEMLPLGEFVTQLLDMINYWDYLTEEAKKDGQGKQDTRKDNVMEFINAASEFQKNTQDDALAAFLENVALVANYNDESSGAVVTLMTLHSAKGLEFDSVFLCGMEEGLFPTSRALNSNEDMEEERRLCYVGITRAMKKLYMSRAEQRMQYDSIKQFPPSRFLREIPDEFINCVNPGGFVREAPKSGGSQFQQSVKTGKSKVAPLSGTGYGAPAFSPPPPVKKNTYDFKAGQSLNHAKFGKGKVLENQAGVLLIDFGSLGEKKIVAAYAPITPQE